MGIFDRWKKGRKDPEKPRNNNARGGLSTEFSYEAAIRLMRNDVTRDTGRIMMREIAEHPLTRDPRVFMWMAQEYEQGKVYSAAAHYYLKALQVGVKEAYAGYQRCNNPYHIDEYYTFTSERGCGTPHMRYVMEEEERQRRDYEAAIEKLNHNPSREDLIECLKTIRLIASAAGCAVSEAQIWMGDFCETVEKDLEEAARWYKRASDNKSADGARCYADMLMSGRGVKKDPEEAMRYYLLAAERGQIEAQFIVANYYQATGDMESAMKYYRLSAKGGYAPAKAQIETIETGATEDVPSYEAAITSKFKDIVIEQGLDSDGMLEYFTEIYQPDDFCKKAYDYCGQQYARFDEKKMMFEYCMTAFYGSICATALWHEDHEPYQNGTPVWDVLSKQIDVEFTDRHADELLGTKQGEEKAERIYSIVCQYMKLAFSVIIANNMKEEVCLRVMRLAYQLGMLVAKKELNITVADFTREFIASHQKKDNDVADGTSKKAQEFFVECSLTFHEEAKENGVANKEWLFIPELLPMGEKAVLAYLQDEFFKMEFGHDPIQYYFVIMALAIQTGICFGEKWHKDFPGLNSYVDEIIKKGPADDAAMILEETIGISGNDVQHAFYLKIFDKWMQCHAPYWELEDPREYTFNSLLAAYQLGVSMVLGSPAYQLDQDPDITPL